MRGHAIQIDVYFTCILVNDASKLCNSRNWWTCKCHMVDSCMLLLLSDVKESILKTLQDTVEAEEEKNSQKLQSYEAQLKSVSNILK